MGARPICWSSACRETATGPDASRAKARVSPLRPWAGRPAGTGARPAAGRRRRDAPGAAAGGAGVRRRCGQPGGAAAPRPGAGRPGERGRGRRGAAVPAFLRVGQRGAGRRRRRKRQRLLASRRPLRRRVRWRWRTTWAKASGRRGACCRARCSNAWPPTACRRRPTCWPGPRSPGSSRATRASRWKWRDWSRGACSTSSPSWPDRSPGSRRCAWRMSARAASASGSTPSRRRSSPRRRQRPCAIPLPPTGRSPSWASPGWRANWMAPGWPSWIAVSRRWAGSSSCRCCPTAKAGWPACGSAATMTERWPGACSTPGSNAWKASPPTGNCHWPGCR